MGKLVAQNSGLKVEVSENDKKIQRKDHRICQLERNLREAKQKYEKLLTQCANLTAAMDCMGRTKAMGNFGGSAAQTTAGPPARGKIVRPVRGGMQSDTAGMHSGVSSQADASTVDSPQPRRRESSRTRVG